MQVHVVDAVNCAKKFQNKKGVYDAKMYRKCKELKGFIGQGSNPACQEACETIEGVVATEGKRTYSKNKMVMLRGVIMLKEESGRASHTKGQQ
jgi:Fe-S-cluster-containing dehydrogenase component